MPEQKFITQSCIISNNTVYRGDEKLFENKGVDVQAFLLSAYQHFNLSYPKFYKMDNLSKLGWLTAELLLQDGHDAAKYLSEQKGMVLANSNSSLDSDIKYFDSVKDFASPAMFVYTLPNIVIGEICIRNNFKGEHAFYIQDSFDTGFIEKQVSYLLSHDILQTCICGWVDVLGSDYKSVLFLVEQEESAGAVLFSVENMDRIFK